MSVKVPFRKITAGADGLRSNDIPLAEAIEALTKIVKLSNQSDDVCVFGTNVMQILSGWIIEGD